MIEKFRVLIPAAGRSSRSGLSYPKTLYRLKGIPILIRIMQLLENYDPFPVIIISPVHQTAFEEVLQEFGKQAEFVFQNEPKGMGDAVLQASERIADDTHIILVWSDIPLLSKITIDHLINCHLACQNNFSLVTSVGNNCYTIVDREKGKLLRIRETRALGIEPAQQGEREIGLFVFKKQPAFAILAADAFDKHEIGEKEHGFLYMIEKLIDTGEKVEGFPIALPNDLLSFNTPTDLLKIENAFSTTIS